MDQLIFASLSHAHYWYEVGMLKVPAVQQCVFTLLHLWYIICTGTAVFIHIYVLHIHVQYICMYGHQSMDQPSKAANPARGQLDRENDYSPIPARS